jgi:hypothetical protein
MCCPTLGHRIYHIREGFTVEQHTEPAPRQSSPPEPPVVPALEQHSATARPGRDHWAIALANGSLLGIGYLLAGRRMTAFTTGLITLTLIAFAAGAARSVWAEILVMVWWVAMVVHGWLLGRRLPRPSRVWRQRAGAMAVTIPVIVAAGWLHVDAEQIGNRVAQARYAGDCTAALHNSDQIWFGDRIADPPRTNAVDRTARACGLARTAADRLTTALGGDTTALAGGFALLDRILTDYPGHDAIAGRVLDGFLAQLRSVDPCHTVAITDWIARRPLTHTLLDRAKQVAAQLAPTALLACQLQTVRQLLQTSSTNLQPAYCAHPQPFGGARPYGHPGPDTALIYGNDMDTQQFPAEWRAHDIADAVLVICAGPTEYGDVVQTCPYTNESSHVSGDVAFHKRAVPLRAYEVRTARVVFDGRVQIGGGSCPPQFTAFIGPNLGPPPDEYVSSADTDVRAAFDPLINP